MKNSYQILKMTENVKLKSRIQKGLRREVEGFNNEKRRFHQTDCIYVGGKKAVSMQTKQNKTKKDILNFIDRKFSRCLKGRAVAPKAGAILVQERNRSVRRQACSQDPCSQNIDG